MNLSFTCVLTAILFLTISCSQQSGNNEPIQEGEDISTNIQEDADMENTDTEEPGTNEIIMTLDPPTMTASSMETAVRQVTNNTGSKLTYGLRYTVEESSNGEWNKLDYLDDILFEDLAHEVKAGEKREESIRFNLGDYTYQKGLYRLCKTFSLPDRDTTVCTQFRVE
ncbi:MAG: immunoglobulin-like domain-containing protein [Cyclobacteriaceae bacterium]